MVDLMTSGLSNALLTANASAKVASKPMNMVARELLKKDPNQGLIDRAGGYGSEALGESEKALDKAQEELGKAQETATKKIKAENEAQLKAKAAEAVETVEKVDTAEISAEALTMPQTKDVVVDEPKIYTSEPAAVMADIPSKPKIDVKA